MRARAPWHCHAFVATSISLAIPLLAQAQPAQTPEAQSTSTPASKAVALKQVTVSGSNAGRTEGSGSYAAESAGTATRMELSLRETPQSVTVITRERLDDLGVVRLDDALALTPGITVGKNDSERANYYARGFAINNFQIDGMPRGANAPLQDLLLYDRIEIVRGATGLMGGTGDPSATVNMVRKRPTRTFQGSASVSAGSWSDHRAEVDLSTPLNADGSVRARGVFGRQNRDSFMDMYHERKSTGMAILEADLTARTLFTAGLDFQDNQPTGATWGAVPYWSASGGLANLPRNFSLSTPWSTWANEQQTLFTSLQHRFDNGWKIHLGYSRTTSRNNTTVAYGGSGYPDPATGKGMSLWSGIWGEAKAINDNIDLHASGPFSLLGRQHTFIAGWNGGYQVSHTPGGSASLGYPAAIADYRTWTGSIPQPVFTPDGSHTEARSRLGGGYLATRLSLSDPLSVIVGARLSDYRTATEQFNTSGQYTRTTGVLRVEREVTPYVGMVYDLDRSHSLYASYTTLFKPQNYKDRSNQYLDPETGTSAEIGIKGEYLDGALNASAALFQTRKRNLAELDTGVPAGFLLPDGSSAYVARADGVTARGVEFDVSGRISPAWNLGASYTFLRATTANAERAVPQQPRHLLRLTTAYRFSGALQGLRLGGSATLQSATYGEWRGGKGRIPQPAYALLNLMASYEISRNLTAQFNINNLFDKKYYRNVGFYDSVFWGDPRSVTLTLRAKF